jgi:hypothetical protein
MPLRRPKRNNKRNTRRPNRRFKVRAKKRAYKPSNKKRFINKSNPIAENKQLEGANLSLYIGNNPDGTPVLPNFAVPPHYAGADNAASGYVMNSTNYVFIPDSPCYQTHGFDESQMQGRSTYQRLCAAKMLIKWPQQTMDTGITTYPAFGALGQTLKGTLPETPQSYKLYWGYVPIKPMLTGQTSPLSTEASAHYLETQVKQRISDYFDNRKDRIAFIPKRTSTINIIGSKTLSAPNYNFNRLPVSTKEPTSTTADGSISDTLVKISWPINKKIHFEPSNKFAWRTTESSPGAGDANTPVAPSTGTTVFYRNYDHYPFAVLVSFNHDKLPIDDSSITNPTDEDELNDRWARTRRCPHILINDITYYRDS